MMCGVLTNPLVSNTYAEPMPKQTRVFPDFAQPRQHWQCCAGSGSSAVTTSGGRSSGAECTPRHAISDQRERPDSADPRLPSDRDDSADAAEPADPTDRIEPTLPIERTEYEDPIDRIEWSDAIDRIER